MEDLSDNEGNQGDVILLEAVEILSQVVEKAKEIQAGHVTQNVSLSISRNLLILAKSFEYCVNFRKN